MKLRVAAAQIPVSRDIDVNAAVIERAIAYAADQGADLLLTPEGSLSGYCADFDSSKAAEALEQLTTQARTRGVGLALGTCSREADGKCYNQIRFYERDGTYLGFHSKILRCGTLEDQPRGEINSYAATPLSSFSLGGVHIGGLICNDMWANPKCTPMPDPHLSHQLCQRGARLILHAVHGGSRDDSQSSRTARMYHEANLLIRAAASELWIVTVDACSPLGQPCSAPSGVVTPSGEWAYRAAPQGEELFTYTIDSPE
ncbi:MAG: carbon-nitrogen hydrolase family protein [Lentisphaerae bacterium]|jgi:predicted amidohydrolase|nr:carbon-nitrogen hydrolase family protein [Lentisphaerota bacterium]MBT4815818.1 carbon-nitrogen hydrolase family protein [Lentisphaerota bacterium]MBT5606223.1 carbon-nitrogen hydrolase family protein [Lentisphaerota bacterium]MBT7057415.1 carbon-nitrogen hydrolase family protein [Lentisphaerota bacterium]MBT7841286.1 carbon-nitrogen hydrolase family protein [Lentisphaerota bacterium]